MNGQFRLNRGFQLSELMVILICGALWYAWPHTAQWLFPIALLPLFVRAFSGNLRLQRAYLDIPLFLFMLTACIGVWNSYQQEIAWGKFWLLLAGTLLYYALAYQNMTQLRLSAGVLACLVVLISIYFIGSNDWLQNPADIEWLNDLALAWQRVRPQALTLQATIPPNFAGGWMAVYIPFQIYHFMRSWPHRRLQALFWLSAIVLTSLGLALTSSRAAWVFLGGALFIWLVWELGERTSRYASAKQRRYVIMIFLALLGLAGGLLIMMSGGPVELASRLPGPNSSITRLEIDRNSLRLVADFPLFGAGLRTFPGLYSQYMLVIPFFMFDYAHNMYLDIVVEQGLFGLAAFLWIMGGSFWLLLHAPFSPHLQGARLHKAVIISLLVMLTHGLVDDAFYGIAGTSMIFTLPGMAAAVHDHAKRTYVKNGNHKLRATQRGPIAKGLILGVIILGLIPTIVVPDIWKTNQAAVQMAQIDLSDFPQNEWRLDTDPHRYAGQIPVFKSALEHNPSNLTALHRLGIIYMAQGNYPQACRYLTKAFALDPNHYGLLKRLAYCFTWNDQPEQAINLFIKFPEAKAELEAYAVWWRNNERSDLAEKALKLAERLELH
jgi:O-antigen ligase